MRYYPGAYHAGWTSTSDGAVPFKLFDVLLVELDGVLGLDRLNAADASLRAQAMTYMKKHEAERMIRDMERAANR